MITPLPGPVPDELTRYLTEHPDWAKQQVHRGFQVWAHARPDGEQDAWCSVPAEAGHEDEDRDDCDRAAFTIARVELGLGAAAHNYREAVRRLADAVSAESLGIPGQAERIAAGEFRVIYDTSGRARGLATQEEYARWESGMAAVRKSRRGEGRST